MKKWLMSITCVFLANAAWGQSPAVQPATANLSVQVCPQPVKTICVPEASTKIKVSINYSSTAQQVCPGGCSIFSIFGKCQTCDGPNCGVPYTKKYLVKKIVTAEEPTIKCIPVTVPACDARNGCQPGLYAPARPNPEALHRRSRRFRCRRCRRRNKRRD